MSHKTDPRTLKEKALEIIVNNNIKRIMNGLWYVKSSETDDEYEVSIHEGMENDNNKYKYYCGCQAYKFSGIAIDDVEKIDTPLDEYRKIIDEAKICKHCVAVKIYENGYIAKDVIVNIISLHENDMSLDDIYNSINQ